MTVGRGCSSVQSIEPAASEASPGHARRVRSSRDSGFQRDAIELSAKTSSAVRSINAGEVYL